MQHSSHFKDVIYIDEIHQSTEIPEREKLVIITAAGKRGDIMTLNTDNYTTRKKKLE